MSMFTLCTVQPKVIMLSSCDSVQCFILSTPQYVKVSFFMLRGLLHDHVQQLTNLAAG